MHVEYCGQLQSLCNISEVLTYICRDSWVHYLCYCMLLYNWGRFWWLFGNFRLPLYIDQYRRVHCRDHYTHQQNWGLIRWLFCNFRLPHLFYQYHRVHYQDHNMLFHNSGLFRWLSGNTLLSIRIFWLNNSLLHH